MGYPTIQKAQALLTWAAGQNPGPWEAHVQHTALAARTIAEAAGMDGEKAYVLGLLHDIGRYEGRTDFRHIIAGYDLLMEIGCPDAARICLTHSFPLLGELNYFIDNHDCTAEDFARAQHLLATMPQDEYDKLIQLCDALGGTQGIVIIEQRIVDAALRHGFNPYTLDKWKETFVLKDYFSDKTGGSVYRLFDLVFV